MHVQSESVGEDRGDDSVAVELVVALRLLTGPVHQLTTIGGDSGNHHADMRIDSKASSVGPSDKHLRHHGLCSVESEEVNMR